MLPCKLVLTVIYNLDCIGLYNDPIISRLFFTWHIMCAILIKCRWYIQRNQHNYIGHNYIVSRGNGLQRTVVELGLKQNWIIEENIMSRCYVMLIAIDL